MKKYLSFFLLTAVISVFAAEKVAVDFKSNMKYLKGVQRSDDIFVTKAPALAVDGRETKGKKHTVAGQHFYIFGNNARALTGKNLVLRAKIKRISGIAPLSMGYRVFGNGNKFMSGRSISVKAAQTAMKITDVRLKPPPCKCREKRDTPFVAERHCAFFNSAFETVSHNELCSAS